jgi:sterol desaturase/sphingolipid hydroxylase (fatty acid hydroxylase superfamily)
MAANRETNNQSTSKHDGGYLVRAATGDLNYWISFVSDPVTIGFFVIWEALVLRTNAGTLLVGYGSGLLSWSLVEYIGHRYLYHKAGSPAHYGHLTHHKLPMKLVALPWFIITAIMTSAWYVFAYYLQFPIVLIYLAGLLTGFVFYGVLHHFLHRINCKNAWYEKLRSHHLTHHQIPNVNFGLTSPLWDYLFRTKYRPAAVDGRRRIDRPIEYSR